MSVLILIALLMTLGVFSLASIKDDECVSTPRGPGRLHKRWARPAQPVYFRGGTAGEKVAPAEPADRKEGFVSKRSAAGRAAADL
jgi:hypothetical protein